MMVIINNISVIFIVLDNIFVGPRITGGEGNDGDHK